MKLLLSLFLALGCSVSLDDHFPRAACLCDQNGMMRRGWVIAKREDDDAQLFKFKDSFEADHGYLWVRRDDATKKIRPCPEADILGGLPKEEFKRQ